MGGSEVTDGRDYSLVETQHGAVVRSSLLVTTLTVPQLGDYVCTVTNALGSVSTTITLRPVDGLPLLITVAAVIGGLLLTLVVIVVAVSCRRLTKEPKKSEQKTPGTKSQMDQVSNSSSQGTKAATLSSLSNSEDLDGSDSLPEYHANYMASSMSEHQGDPVHRNQPDLVYSHGPPGVGVLEPGWHGYGHSQDLHSAGYLGPEYRGTETEGICPEYVVTSPERISGREAWPGVGRGRPCVMEGLEDCNESSVGTHV